MKEYRFKGETFQVGNFEGCLQVVYKGLSGYVGVNLNPGASDRHPFAATTTPENISANGVMYGNFVGPFRSVLNRLCTRLVNMDLGRDFDRERYRQVLNDFVDRLETGPGPTAHIAPTVPYGCGD